MRDRSIARVIPVAVIAGSGVVPNTNLAASDENSIFQYRH